MGNASVDGARFAGGGVFGEQIVDRVAQAHPCPLEQVAHAAG